MGQNMFKLNVEKTNLLVVGTAARLQRTPCLEVQMENNMLEEKPSKKECLLGIIVQHDLK